MKIEYTPRYIKDYSNIKDVRAKKDTDKVERLINMAPNFIELHKLLDIKKYDPGLGGYRIRYGGRPEWRIRFDLIDDPINPKEKVIKLQMVLPREKYEKYAHISINESIDKPFKVIITETQYKRLVEDLYNPLDNEVVTYGNTIPPFEVGDEELEETTEQQDEFNVNIH